jgi:hypothetical protein
MARELSGWSRPRPLRVAFLVEEGEHADLILDGIFADCYSRWGGRFSLIVPCRESRILPRFWPWLEAYDPDVVYSYVPLAKGDVLELHERLSPSEYLLHKLGRQPRLDVFGFKPDYKFSPLSSLSTIFRLVRLVPPLGRIAPNRIINAWHTEAPSRFLTDNFGTYYWSRATEIYPADAEAAATLLTIVSPKYKVGGYGVPPHLHSVESELDAFREFAQGRATSLSLISALFAPKLQIEAWRWSGSFNLVVGHSFADRILFWNARHLIPGWLDFDLCCLRVDLEQLEQAEFAAVLGDTLKRRNRVNGGAGGQPQLSVRSVSLDRDQLARARELVLAAKPWGMVTAEAVNGVDDLVPSSEALDQAREESNRSLGMLFPHPDWRQFRWSQPIARPPENVPDHLSDAPARQYFIQGYWCTDFTFEHDGPGSRFAQQNRWELPRRWRMAGAFKPTLLDGGMGNRPPPPRRSREGNFTVFVSAERPVETIEVPTPYDAMLHALAIDGQCAKQREEHGQIDPPNKLSTMQPSNEARYLTGILGMTGGLHRASQFLLHPFLRQQFAKLGGTPNLPDADMVTPTLNRLRKRARPERAFDLRNDRDVQALGNFIIRAARALKRPQEIIRYVDLKSRWKAHRAAFWSANRPPVAADPGVDWDAHEEGSLDACLVELRRRQMLFQGHRWTCQNCHHRNWVDFSELSSQLSCEVCKRRTQAPIAIDWLFRPNEFLIESLRDHSVLSLIWVLSALCEESRRSLIFVGPTWFGFSPEAESPDAEADLLVILDGRAMLCEAKASWHALRTGDVGNFVALASRLRPDIALLAVMENGPAPETELTAARERLATEKIEFRLLTPKAYMPLDDPYLPSYEEE